ncbi:hypothetical protein FQA39_LY02550 [Lamprigera yunnana]|nr:hypothetical protein FQA39_LY02550 [Lamprigera yunnana]
METASIMNLIYNIYHTVFVKWADPRVENFFLMRNPLYCIGILGFYIYFVLKLGPKLMEKRRPYKINKLLVAFNAAQIIVCAYLVYMYSRRVLFEYNHFCEPIDYSNSERATEIVKFTYYYHLLKLVDLFDTVFFVLRKKYSQITFLHVYHHAGMCILTWVGTKYLAGGHGIFIGVINSLVHVVMYSYYLLTSWDEKYKNSVWWKKYLTQLQIFQFLLITLHLSQVLFQPNCNYPRWIVFVLIPQNVLMVILFTNFYIHEYVKKKEEMINHNSVQKSE